jgi:purine-binding chemotaxis protein CheW
MKDDKTTAARPSIPVARANEILKARALELARPLQGGQAAGPTLQVVEFRLAQERFAVEQAYVREVFPLKELTPLPCTPAFVAGIINVRGQILTVIDIKKFFDLPEAGLTDLHMVLIVQAGDVELGILADVVTGVRSIPLDALQPSLPTLTGIRARYLKGVTSEHATVLDVPSILADPRIVVNEEVAG